MVKPLTDDILSLVQNKAACFFMFFERISDRAFSQAIMALEIIVRRRRNFNPPPDTAAREKSPPPERANGENPPANDNEGAWPIIPFPDGGW
jgi:hypothetical protein